MPEEGFLRRWSRLKATGGEEAEAPARPSPAAPVPAPVPSSPPAALRPQAAADAPPPTIEDAARLTPESDFSAFVGQGVDKAVQRLALKKLFADPHFHVMDGLDMYMDDYNKPSPMSAAMFAALEHAKSALRPSEPARPPEAPAEGLPAMDGAARPEADAGVAAPDGGPGGTAAGEALPIVPHADAEPGQAAPARTPSAPIEFAPPACAQTGAHPQSLQGQA